MLKLRQLKIRAFSSFTEEAIIDFEPNSLVLLSGRNGSGKSSLTEAIALPLGYNNYSTIDLQNWFTKEPLMVTETFDSDEGQIVLSKGKKTTLTIDNQFFKGSVAQIDEKMKELLGGNIDTDTLSLLCYRQQKQPGLLLSLTDGDKKEFLTKVLPLLAKFEKAIEESSDKASALKAKLEAKRANVQSISLMVGNGTVLDTSTIEARLINNKKLVEEFNVQHNEYKEIVRVLELGYKEAQTLISNKYKDLIDIADKAATELYNNVPDVGVDYTELNRLEDLLEECKARTLELTIADNQVIAELTNKKKELEALKNQKKLSAGRKPLLEQKVAEMQVALVPLLDQKCDRCLRPWDDTETTIANLQADMSNLQIAIGMCEQARLEAIQLEHQINEIEFTPNPDIKEFEATKELIQKEYNDENNRISVLIATHASKHQVIYQKALNKVTELTNSKLQELNKLQTAHKKVLADHEGPQSILIVNCSDIEDEITNDTIEFNRLKAQIEHYNNIKDSLDKATEEVSALELEYNKELEFFRMIGREGFLGSIFEEILDQIADETNKTLASVANTSHCSIRFKTENETKKGTIQKKIVPVISVGGKEGDILISKGRPKCSAVSGGMMSTIELAVDLALGYVIEQRHGLAPGWLVLDEVFEGLDSVSKDTCLEILQKYAQTKLVIVVDHTPEFTSMFNKVIEVEQKDGHSYIKQV